MTSRVILLVMFAGIACCGGTPPLSSAKLSSNAKHPGVHADRTAGENTDPTFKTQKGFMGDPDQVTITGVTLKTFSDKEVYGFRGIFYGENTSTNRFKKSSKKAPYFGDENKLDATNFGSKCPQLSVLSSHMNEDCLTLNVYINKLPVSEADKQPVMIYIHGGSFVSGDASSYLPTMLLDSNDIILVVIQYRLGTLGFFSLQNDDAPGNAALWDQYLAINWVHDNIQYFGGDNSKVTLFGEGAGAVMANYMLFNPDITDKVHGVIAEGGSALDIWALDSDPVASATDVAAAIGCTEPDEIYTCMSSKSSVDLVNNLHTFLEEERKAGRMGFRGASPVIGNIFWNLPPAEYYKRGDVVKVPLMIGANKHEGSYALGDTYWNFLKPNSHEDDKEYLRFNFMSDITSTIYDDPTGVISSYLQRSYIRDRDLADMESASPGLIDMLGMMYGKSSVLETARLHASLDEAKVYLYSFDFESDDSLFKIFFPDYSETTPFKPGVTHGDELMYLFKIPDTIDLDEEQINVKDQLVTFWTNFAKSQNPTPGKSNAVQWDPLTTDKDNYMLIELDSQMKENYMGRWHIALDEDTETTPTTTMPTDEPTISGSSIMPTDKPFHVSKAEYDHVSQQRVAFMVCMIVFLVTTVALGGVSAFLFIKKR